MNLVEDSQYDHTEYGRVRLVSIDEAAGDVLFERTDATISTGAGRIPAGTREAIDTFEAQAEPAPITVSTPAATMDAESTDLL